MFKYGLERDVTRFDTRWSFIIIRCWSWRQAYCQKVKNRYLIKVSSSEFSLFGPSGIWIFKNKNIKKLSKDQSGK